MNVFAAAPRDDWSGKFQNEDIVYVEIPMERRGMNPLRDIKLFFNFYKLYKLQRPDVVFHNTIKPVIYGTFAARAAGIHRIINMVPGLGYVFIGTGLFHLFLRSFVMVLYKTALRFSHKVFFQNPDDKNYFVQNKLVDIEKTEVTYGSGVDLDHFYFVQPRDSEDNCTFLFIGRILKDKGIIEFIEAAKKIKREFPQCRFLLLGKLDKENPAHVDELTLRSWTDSGIIKYLGETADVREVIAQSDVVVLPSYREGVPKAILESMAMGKAIITTDAPGCRETIVGNRNGILIPIKDIENLYLSMKKMIEHPTRRVTMSFESRKIAQEKFNVDNVTELLVRSLSIQ